MYECETCPGTFRTQRACYQHMNDKNHWAPTFACESCTREFSSQHSADQRMNALGHWKPKFPCETCTQMFRTQNAADRHMRELGHYRNYCEDCGIRFQNQNNLEMCIMIDKPACSISTQRSTAALVPSAHSVKPDTPPPAASPTASPTILREVPALALQILTVNPSSVQFASVTRTESSQTSSLPGTMNRMSITLLPTAHTTASPGSAICHRKFDSKSALNMHVNSPVHKQRVYHCPNSKRKCSKQFSTVAALFNHLESGSCAFMRFENVQQHMRSVLQGQKVITL
ncbi:hypothetical protein AJ78_01633 [Emergomyces pasteurianus Ep9510]|uniref:C2H2-type domain-containing protein n=1 Tax=Emergomyces pasteurianus Ep9510 TaxID=1447872 RepID=A0A1J9PPB4_9EURO|nr:hypothetical protein AJ78_01633 [Emergomyces pasteurianus Ep9510]